MSLQVDLSPELQAFVQREVDQGHYDSPADVIREALELLRSHVVVLEGGSDGFSRLAAWYRAIAGGEESIEREGVIECTDTLMEDILQRALAHAERIHGPQETSRPQSAQP